MSSANTTLGGTNTVGYRTNRVGPLARGETRIIVGVDYGTTYSG
jgi:hypothetical protein